MYSRLRHQKIYTLLKCFNESLLKQAQCYFAGGTAIVLLLDEYRESVDLDFLCAYKEGYKQLRNRISQNSLGDILKLPVKHLREVRSDRYGIRTFLEVEGIPIKVEIVFEARIILDCESESLLPVPVLSRTDMFAEKLLANCDRGMDAATASRDAIDLAMMINRYGGIPDASWSKAESAYGQSVVDAFVKVADKLKDVAYREACLSKMAMDISFSTLIVEALEKESRKLLSP